MISNKTIKKIHAFFLTIPFLLIVSCTQVKTLSTPIQLTPPKIYPVKVINGRIEGDNLKNTIRNHVNAWEYIHKSQALLKRGK